MLSAFVLERLKEDAERRLGPIRQVVITVPAFFDETRRKATQDAGRLAGLEVLDIINEPTAAAVAFGYHRAVLGRRRRPGQAAERLLVYDLGGGTFDVTILEIDGTTFRTLATDGDVRLGGKDFDERLVNYVAEQFLGRARPRSRAAIRRTPRSSGSTPRRPSTPCRERRKTTIVCFHHGHPHARRRSPASRSRS